MPQVLSGVVARPPVIGALTNGVDGLTRAIASWVEITEPRERERLVHWAALACIMLVGVIVRFWGLSGVGLHGDEETMAMAVRHMLIDGTPTLPSGMFYPRGLSQQYLMVASTQMFGMSEWALRMPSAVAGSLLIPLAFLVGRRFLAPTWNAAFVASVAFLPEFVVYSQTARMYIFLLVCLAAAIACVFAWERNGRIGWLALASIALIIGIELHALAAFSSLVLLMPGLVRGDWRRVLYGAGATAFVLFGYLIIDGWVNAQYPVPPSDYASDLPPPTWREGPRGLSFGATQYAIVSVAGIIALLAALRLSAPVRVRGWAIAIGLLAAATICLQLLRFYHLAAFTMLATCVLVLRQADGRFTRALGVFIAFSAVLAAVQAGLLYASGIHSPTKLVGAMVGQPSVWPYVRVSGYSEAAAILCAALACATIFRLARQRPIPDYFFLGVLTIGIPLFVMGLFLWDLPVRYTAGSAIPLILCGFAFAQAAIRLVLRGTNARTRSLMESAVAIAMLLLVVNPVSFARVVNSGYETHPDHKGAAEFIRSQHIVDDDIVIAEDVLQQTYYLGSVDYWLISREVARRFVHRVDGEIRDFYTNSGVIASGAEFEALLEKNRGKRIFVIGSGENQEDGRRYMRGFGIFEVLASDRFKVEYIGRDGLTKVWRAVATEDDYRSRIGTTATLETESVPASR